MIGPPGLQTVFWLFSLSPTEEILLSHIAIGLGLFGTYCFAWTVNRGRQVRWFGVDWTFLQPA
jgi:hypothetical protein